MEIPGNINLPSILTGGTARVLFAKDAKTPAAAAKAGFVELGERINLTPQIEESLEEVLGSPIPGQLDRVDQRVTQRLTGYEMEADSWNRDNVRLLFGGKDDADAEFTQAELTAEAVDDIVFTVEEPSVAGKWYPILNEGAQVMNVETVTAEVGVDPIEEGTDFELDKAHGMIRFLTEQTDTVALTVTADAVAEGDDAHMYGFEVSQEWIQRGIMRVMVYDQHNPNRLVLQHRDFRAALRVTAAGAVNGEGMSEITINAGVMYPHGELLLRGANAGEPYQS